MLVLIDEEGRMGIGEASPLPGHSQETLSDCILALDGIHSRVTWDVSGWPSGVRRAATPSALFALETAMLDLMARRAGVSVAKWLGGVERPIARNAVVQSLEQAEAAWARGIRTLKVKVGDRQKEASKELHFLSSLRHRFGPDLNLRLDANAAWSIEEARAQLAAYVDVDPEFVEQPVGVESLAQLGPCAVPWAADESLADDVQADALLMNKDCAALVLKPALLGFRRTRALALAAHAKGIGVVITHSLDGPVGLASACELALSLPFAPRSCGLDGHPGLSAWPPVPIPHHSGSAALIVPSGYAGLGFPTEGLPWT